MDIQNILRDLKRERERLDQWWRVSRDHPYVDLGIMQGGLIMAQDRLNLFRVLDMGTSDRKGSHLRAFPSRRPDSNRGPLHCGHRSGIPAWSGAHLIWLWSGPWANRSRADSGGLDGGWTLDGRSYRVANQPARSS